MKKRDWFQSAKPIPLVVFNNDLANHQISQLAWNNNGFFQLLIPQ